MGQMEQPDVHVVQGHQLIDRVVDRVLVAEHGLPLGEALVDTHHDFAGAHIQATHIFHALHLAHTPFQLVGQAHHLVIYTPSAGVLTITANTSVLTE